MGFGPAAWVYGAEVRRPLAQLYDPKIKRKEQE